MFASTTPPAPDASDAAADLRAATAGDAEAFGRIYTAHVGRIHALALRLTGDAARAEELVQTAFIRAWRKLASFRGESAFGTWMHRLTVNVFFVDDRIDLERAVAKLPEGARTAFVLFDVYGYSHDEIATMSGVASGTIRAQLHRARKRLMEELDQ